MYYSFPLPLFQQIENNIMETLIEKHKRETERELSHTDIYFGDVFIGYIIRNKSLYRGLNENWNFVSKNDKLNNITAKTRKALISDLEQRILNSLSDES